MNQQQDERVNVPGEGKAPATQSEPSTDHGAAATPWSGPVLVRSVSLTGLFVLAVLYTMYFAAPVLMPIALAFLLSMLLSAPVRWLARIGIAEPIGAAAVVVGMLATFATVGYLIAEPASDWAARAPEALEKIEARLKPVRESVEAMQETAADVADATQIDSAEPTRMVQVRRKTLSDIVLSGTPRALAGMLVLIVLLYFWLAGGDTFLRKLVRIIPRLGDQKRAVEAFRTMQRDVSHYLGVVTLINIGLGSLTAIAMWLLGVPNPMLWGFMVALFNFAPYVGALASLTLLTLVGFSTFDTMSQALLVPGVFLVLTSVEGQIVSPIIIGKRLALSTLAVFVSLLVLGWMWGLLGALMAVPMLAIIKIVCERIPPLEPVGELLGR